MLKKTYVSVVNIFLTKLMFFMRLPEGTVYFYQREKHLL